MTKQEFERVRKEEGDRYEFKYQNYDCFILRHPTLLTLNGYLIISKLVIDILGENYISPISFDSVIQVHGGATYERTIEDNNPFLNSVKQLHPGDYVIGFDCSHAGDFTPGLYAGLGFSGQNIDGLSDFFGNHDCYRDKEYVISEIKSMVDQMNEFYPEYNIAKVRDESIDKLID